DEIINALGGQREQKQPRDRELIAVIGLRAIPH
ncbi:MAG: hypothetical protein JWM16_3368, partial [Verrucomicrobiales bacterium]|nr:hypothetical protein [Verrucomicrobiales bacterium]